MSNNFTPGPWAARNNGYFWEVSSSHDEFSQSIVHVPQSAFIEGDAEANARLIASAPDLFDIVQTIGQLLDEGEFPSVILNENSPICDAIREVIAKATGGAS